jgi:hypothetical protein
MLTVAPTDANTRVWRARVDLESRADPRPAHITIYEILAEDSGAAAGFAQQWFLVALCERDPAEATRAVGFMPPEGITPTNIRYPRSFFEALVARAQVTQQQHTPRSLRPASTYKILSMHSRITQKRFLFLA